MGLKRTEHATECGQPHAKKPHAKGPWTEAGVVFRRDDMGDDIALIPEDLVVFGGVQLGLRGLDIARGHVKSIRFLLVKRSSFLFVDGEIWSPPPTTGSVLTRSESAGASPSAA
jgi:hypothetical protein